MQCGIGRLSGFRETHHVTSERAHTVSSYLPDFDIVLPHHECSRIGPTPLLSDAAQK
jgi:hypothetical protein